MMIGDVLYSPRHGMQVSSSIYEHLLKHRIQGGMGDHHREKDNDIQQLKTITVRRKAKLMKCYNILPGREASTALQKVRGGGG